MVDGGGGALPYSATVHEADDPEDLAQRQSVDQRMGFRLLRFGPQGIDLEG